jgi:hypothetical protein
MLTIKRILNWPLRCLKNEWENAAFLVRLMIIVVGIFFSLVIFLGIASWVEQTPSFETLAAKDDDTSFQEWRYIEAQAKYSTWDEASFTLIITNMQQKAETYDDWMDVRNTVSGRAQYKHVEKLALTNMLNQTEAYEQAKFVYKHDDYNRDIKGRALEKMAQLAESYDEWEYIFEKTYPAHSLHARALKAMKALSAG